MKKALIFVPFYRKTQKLVPFGDPYGTRTHDTTVKGWCLNRLTNGPNILKNGIKPIFLVAMSGVEPLTYRV